MAIVNAFNVALEMFSDMGLWANIIRAERAESPSFYNTIWTLQIIRGSALWIIASSLAWPLAHLYSEPRLSMIIPVNALSVLITAFASTASASLQRRVTPGRAIFANVASQTFGVCMMITLAVWKPTIWALVIGSLIGNLTSTIWSHFLIPGYKNRFAWDRETRKEVVTFGRWIFVSSIMTFLAAQSDRFILGKLLSLKWLGIYSIAYHLSGIPREIIGKLSGNVIFPVVSRLGELGDDVFQAKVQRIRNLSLLGSATMIIVLVSSGDGLVSLLYDRRYHEARVILPILALGIWPMALVNLIQPMLLARGLSKYPAYASFAKFLTILAGLPLGYALGGVMGAVCVMAFVEVPVYLVYRFSLRRLPLKYGRSDLRATLLFLAALLTVLWIRASLGGGGPFPFNLF